MNPDEDGVCISWHVERAYSYVQLHIAVSSGNDKPLEPVNRWPSDVVRKGWKIQPISVLFTFYDGKMASSVTVYGHRILENGKTGASAKRDFYTGDSDYPNWLVHLLRHVRELYPEGYFSWKGLER